MTAVIYKEYEPSSILNDHKHVDGGWFWDKYSAFSYMGCYYGCEYRYWRDEKYNRLANVPEAAGLDDPFSQYIKIKKNAMELLRKSLVNKPREIIYIDSYQPIESKYGLARKMLEVCADMNFPVFINEKSPLLLKDLDLLKRIRKTYMNVGFSIVFSKENSAKKTFESRAPSIRSRFKAMKKLSDHRIIVGTVFMPILPFICDTEENIKAIVKETKDAGGSYVLDGGLTLWGYCGIHFYRFLKEYDISLVQKYKRLYSDQKVIGKQYAKTHELVKKYCDEYNLDNYISRPTDFYPKKVQVNKKIAERFYLKSREIMMTEGRGYRQYANLRVAWTLDSITDNVKEIYAEKGKKGLLDLRGVGRKMSDEIINVLDF
jgi:DNA repair photolyase